jgi:hypothetical protein
MNKILVSGIAAAGIAGGSLGIAALAPLGLAGAQDSGSTTTAPSTQAAPTPGDHKGPLDEVLKSLVDDNTITQAQADAIKARLEANRPKDAPGDNHAEGRRGGPGPELDAAAAFLGTTAADLRTQLESGKTLAQVAGDKTDALIADLVAKANARIDDAVKSGKLDQTKADQLKTDTAQRITDMVNGKMPAGGPKGGPKGGHGPRGGQPPAAPSAPSATAPGN